MALTFSIYSILVENNLTLLASTASNYFITAASGSTTYFNVDNKGNLSTLGGHLANATYSGSYTDGTIIDYQIGNGRIIVGPNDNLSLYTGGINGATMSVFATNSITFYQPTTINSNLTVTGNSTLNGTLFSGTHSVLGNISATGSISSTAGILTTSTYSSTYSSGAVIDYATGNGRISVGSNANLSIYTGGLANTPISIFGTNSVIMYQPLTVNATYSTTSAAANINISGYNTKGGSSYLDFLAATNTVSGATNPTKWFRLDNSGTLQIINSLYSSAIFALTDSGALSITATASAAALTITQNYPTADCLLQLRSRDTTAWTRIGSNGSDMAIITGGTDLTNGTPGLHISSLNNVGINGVATRARLDIKGAIAGYASTQTYAYYALSGTTTNTGYYNGSSQTITPSIWADQRVLASEFDAISDERIKDIKGISNNTEDLDILKQIQITDYQYKDKIANGTNNFKKVIGQQVQKVFPQAVKEQKDIVPDIFKLANIINGVVQLVADVKEGDTIKIIAQTGELKVKVISVNEENFTIDNPLNEECFIYGKEVDDFVVVDYDALSMLNISATQEIIKRLELLEKENEELRKLLK